MKTKDRLGDTVRPVKSFKSPKRIAFSLVESSNRQWGRMSAGKGEAR
jgi:hypothetical protein